MIHAYAAENLADARDSLGTAVEFAVLNCRIKGQDFLDMFLVSGISERFGRGDSRYILGMSGVELALKVIERCGKTVREGTSYYLDPSYSPEYWAGWILAYYQWYTGKQFSQILNVLKYDLIMDRYVLHEADESKAADVFDRLLSEKEETGLARIRKACGLSQSELAKASGVSLRSIQMYEQKRNNIERAQFNHLDALSKILHCSIRDIVD